jgi:hypothetical protein
LDPLRDLLKPSQDRARQITAEQVVAAGGDRDDVCGCGCRREVGEHAVCCVAVAPEVD